MHTVVTDGSGAYRIELPPGAYAVRFELSGFARQETPKLEVQLGRIYDLDASLKVGNVTEAVQVTAENAPLVDTRSTIIAHNVTAEEIDRLPKGRSFQSIALTAPSVNSGEIEGGFQVNGASGAENAFTVDGVVTNSLVNGSSRQNTVFEYIQEVQVKTTGIPAEFGGALGGVISAVTKSGGNIFTGEGHYYFDGSPLSAGPVNRLVLESRGREDGAIHPGREDAGHPARVRRLGRRADRPGQDVLLRIVFAASEHEDQYLQLLERSRGRRHRADHQVDSGIWQGQRRQPQSERLLSLRSSRRPMSLAHCRPTTDLARTGWPAAKQATQPNIDRGWEQMQANVNGNVDVVISNGAYATFRAGRFHDRYTDTGIPQTTHWSYQAPAPAVLSNGATLPSNIVGPSLQQNTPRVADHRLRHDPAHAVQCRLQPHVPDGGWHTLKGGVGFQRHGERHQPAGIPAVTFTSSGTGRSHSADSRTIGAPTATTKSTIAARSARPAPTSSRCTCRISGRSAIV